MNLMNSQDFDTSTTHSIACFSFSACRVIQHVLTVSVLWVQSPRITEENQGGALRKNNWADKKPETHQTKSVFRSSVGLKPYLYTSGR